MTWDTQAFDGTRLYVTVTTTIPFLEITLLQSNFRVCDVIMYFEVMFLKGSELDETMLILRNGQYGGITAQHPSADLCVWRCFYRHPWGSPEWCMSSWSNNLRKGHQTCAARSLLPVASLQAAGLFLLHSDTPWALYIANRREAAREVGEKELTKGMYSAKLIFFFIKTFKKMLTKTLGSCHMPKNCSNSN